MESFPRGNRPGGKERGGKVNWRRRRGRGEKEQVGESPALQLWHIKHTKRGPGGAGTQTQHNTRPSKQTQYNHRERERERAGAREINQYIGKKKILSINTPTQVTLLMFLAPDSLFLCFFFLFLNVFVGDRMVW